jgi:rhodanese-related sulfurtransferase
MPRLNYALPVDVIRKFDPTLEPEDLDNNEFIGHDDEEIIIARIEGLEAKWDRRAAPMRPVRVGGGDTPKYKSAKGAGFPVHVYLDHMNVIPFDSAQGDVLERRTGRDSWTNIMNREGSAWVADYDEGKLTLYTLPGRGSLPALRRHRDRFVRLSYRLGAGGGYATAGQTTLSSALATGTTDTVAVADASRLPETGGTMLVGGTEYVEVSAVDHAADEITIRTRGLRVSSDTDHPDGTVVHYCPLDVREAIAAKAARELVIYDDYTDWMVEGSEAFDRRAKLEEWESEWTTTVANYSDAAGYN